MAKNQREFIKLELKLLFLDPRFWQLSDFEQLTYIKLIGIGKLTDNKVTKDLPSLEGYMRSKRPLSDLQVTLDRLMSIFPNLKSNKHYYFFTSWKKRYPKKGTEKEKDIDKEKEYSRERLITILKTFTTLKNLDFGELEGGDFGRYFRAIKTLLKRAKGDDGRVVQAMKWVAAQNYCDWTLETVDKKWLDANKKPIEQWQPTNEQLNCPNCKGTGWRYDENNKTYKCECRKQ